MIIITLSKFSRGINGLWAKVKSHVSNAISGMVISESTGSLPEGELDTEMTRNKVTSLSSQSTDTQYPSAKCVYDALGGKQETINDLNTIRQGAALGATALQQHQSLEGYATQQWVGQQGYLTEHQSLEGYATQQWVGQQGYLTQHQSLAGYATQQWVGQQGYLTEHQSLSGYATQQWVGQQGYLTQHQSLSGYAKVVSLTQAEYDALAVKDTTTIYIITDAE